MRSLIIISGVLAVAHAGPANAGDLCRVYRDRNLAGPTFTTTLPGVTAPALDAWGSTGVRHSGADFNPVAAPGVWANVSSALVRAIDSDVTLYLFDGADFDGTMVAVRCEKGRECRLPFVGTSMDDRTRSMICQREYTSPTAASIALPTRPIADVLPARFSAEVAKTGQGYAQKKSAVQWSTAWRRERRAGFASSWQAKYIDELRLFHAFTVVTPWFAPSFDVEVTMDFRPVIHETALDMWWAQASIFVEDTIYTDAATIRRQLFDAIGAAKMDDAILQGFQQGAGEAYYRALGIDPRTVPVVDLRSAGADLLSGLARLQMGHTCTLASYVPWSLVPPVPYPCTNATFGDAYAPEIVINRERLAH